MAIWTLAAKDLRLLLRDRRAVVILLAMPFLFVLVLGLALGEGFGQKPDDKLRVSIVDLDLGKIEPVDGYPDQPWSKIVLDDLAKTSEIRVEIIPSLDEAESMVRQGKRAAVLVFGPNFSRDMSRCSFLKEGKNPMSRDGVNLVTREAGHPRISSENPDALDVEVLVDPTQRTASSIIKQGTQVTLLRVILPWMIGQAFGQVGNAAFIEKLSSQKQLPESVKLALTFMPAGEKKQLGAGLQASIQDLFAKYKLTGKTWADLTMTDPGKNRPASITNYAAGDQRYQILVPSFTVMFAFFLVLTVGWLFVGERRQGTMKRLKAAPLDRSQILLGKLVPCFALSVFQGLFMLAAGKVAFGMSWGSRPDLLVAVALCTSLSATGLSLFVASVARTETQVAIYGTLLVIVLAGVSGCLTGDREMMPEQMQLVSRFTPHAWALDAYKQLLTTADPNVEMVGQACGILVLFGFGFTVLAWWSLRLD